MEDAEASRPFYERRWFKGTAAVVGLLGATFALIGPPKLWDVVHDLVWPDLPPSNTEYVLDASAGMGDAFGAEEESTKLSAAARTIGRSVGPLEHEGLALRRFGGPCEETGELLVDFSGGHNAEVSDAAADQEAGGRSNLAGAVIAAIDDFNDGDRFPADQTFTKRIVVVTGTVDECSGDRAAELIRRRLERSGIELDFTYVGLGIPESDRDQLREIAGDEQVVFADTEDELAGVVTFLELEPVIADSHAFLEIHNVVIDRLNTFSDELNAGRTEEASAALTDSKETFSRTESRLQSIGAHEARAELAEMSRLVEEARSIQEELFATGDTLLELRRELGPDATSSEYENALAEWNGVIDRQRTNVGEIEAAIGDLAGRIPPLEN